MFHSALALVLAVAVALSVAVGGGAVGGGGVFLTRARPHLPQQCLSERLAMKVPSPQSGLGHSILSFRRLPSSSTL